MTRARGFTLIELLVALAVFAALAAAAYGGLAALARTRAALAAQQDRFAAVLRSVSLLERELQQAVDRPVLGNGRGEVLPALAGGTDRIEFTRLGFANPRAEPRSNLQRVVYTFDGTALRHGRFGVLDRAPDSAPAVATLLDRVGGFQVRYLGCDAVWRDAWPPAQPPGCAQRGGTPLAAVDALPLAVEFHLTLADLGELRRIVELPSPWPARAPPP
mgnify:CR=1 FL=1